MNNNNISFLDYDRISDTLYWLSNKIILRFVVTLSRRAKGGGRVPFHTEIESTSKFIGTTVSRSIKRNINFYFVLDNNTDFGNGFILRTYDVYMLVQIIEQQILPWFFDPKKRLFSIIEDKDTKKLIIKGVFKPVIYPQEPNRYIKMEPCVISYEDGTFKEGIRFTLNSESEFADLDIDTFLGLFYILKNTDMYSAACSMINYVKIPPYGNNIFRPQGLGGGFPQENWSTSEDIETSNKRYSGNSGTSSQNSFLNNVKRKET